MIGNMTIKTKALLLFISFIVLSLGVTVFFAIRVAETHFSKQVEDMLASEAQSLNDKLKSFDMVAKELNTYIANDVQKLLNNEIESIIDTSERVASAYMISGEGEFAIQFRVLDIIDKKTVGKSGFAFALDEDGMMSVMPDRKFAKEAQPLIEKIAKEKNITLNIPFQRNGSAIVACRPNERFKVVICAAIPDTEVSASSDFIDKYAKDSFENFVKTKVIAKTGYYYLVDEKGTIIMHPQQDMIGKNLADEDFIHTIITEKNGSLKYRWNGIKKLVGFAHIDSMNTILVGGADINEFIGSMKRDIILRPVLVGVVVIIIASLLVNMLINRTIVGPIKSLGTYIEKVSTGDLTTECRLTNNDEVGTIGTYLTSMTDHINSTLANVKSSAVNVKHHSESLYSSGTQLSEAIKAQSERTGNVERSIQEILASFDDVSANIQELSSEINMIRSSASDGHKVLENTVNGIKNLAETVIGTSGTINSLGESSKQIIEIVKVISDIADQTNLLALNAAIEAARAGEHGRGFAVVADEVRKLAERTVTATAEINEMTSGISKDVNRSVQDMQAGAQLAKEGEDLASELQASLEGIIHGVVEAAEKIESVSAAITQQNESSRKISEDSSQIAGFSKNNAEIAASNRQQSEMLKELASGLQLAVEKFRLKS
jgi:methyl-accepting chemotaxis protein